MPPCVAMASKALYAWACPPPSNGHSGATVLDMSMACWQDADSGTVAEDDAYRCTVCGLGRCGNCWSGTVVPRAMPRTATTRVASGAWYLCQPVRRRCPYTQDDLEARCSWTLLLVAVWL